MEPNNQYVVQTPQEILTCINISEPLVADNLYTGELGVSLHTDVAISWSLAIFIYKMVE